jgi:hypothetical protein
MFLLLLLHLLVLPLPLPLLTLPALQVKQLRFLFLFLPLGILSYYSLEECKEKGLPKDRPHPMLSCLVQTSVRVRDLAVHPKKEAAAEREK